MIWKTDIQAPQKMLTKIQLEDLGFTIIDTEDFKNLAKYRWILLKSRFCHYVCRKTRRKGKSTTIRLHREIAGTPAGMECHHINHNPLDNRRCNLQNLTPQEHREIHQFPEIA